MIALGDLTEVLDAHSVGVWGVASNEPPMPLAPELPRAISMMVPYDSADLADVAEGPNAVYYAAYRRLNASLNEAVAALADLIRRAGYAAEPVEATLEDYEEVEDWGHAGVFAHKTAATRAGLGWIGKTALFLSPVLGPKGRLATVFTDMPLEPGEPIDAGRCGTCRVCVDACPVDAGRDVTWSVGMDRDLLFDEKACEAYLDRFPEFGGVCGICVAVCPFGKRALAGRASS